jgi:hypothetical protein
MIIRFRLSSVCPCWKRSSTTFSVSQILPKPSAWSSSRNSPANFPDVPVLVLGDAKGATAEYPADGVRFLTEPIASEEMLSAASQLLAGDGSARRVQ